MSNVNVLFNGVIDDAARFVEKNQLLQKALWEKVIAVFDYRKFQEGWHGEYWGKLMRGGCIVYKYTKSEELYSMLTYAVKGLIACRDNEGRITAYDKDYEFYDWDVWCRKYVMYGLMYYMEICKDEAFKNEILSALMKHADYIITNIGIGEGKKKITETSDYWLGVNSSSILRPYVMLYKLTGKKLYLSFAEYIISQGGIRGGNLIEIASEDKLAPFQYPEVKAYETMSFFEGVFEYATLVNNQDLIDACIKFGNKILETDITLIGATGCYDELFDNSTKKQVIYTTSHMQETCVTVTFMEYMCRLLEYTGDGKYADAIEVSFYNAFLGAINRGYGQNDGLHFDSYSPILNNRRGWLIGGRQKLLDGSYYGCCAAIGPAGFGAVTSMAAVYVDDCLRISFYEDGEINFGSNKLCVKTNYPFDGKITIYVERAEEAFNLALRIPSWCKSSDVTLNGVKFDYELDKGYLVIDKCLETSNEIVLSLEMPFVVKDSSCFDSEVNDYFAITRGPLVFATEDYGEYNFVPLATDSCIFDKMSISTVIKTEEGKEIKLSNYATVGLDWKKNMTVWLKQKN